MHTVADDAIKQPYLDLVTFGHYRQAEKHVSLADYIPVNAHVQKMIECTQHQFCQLSVPLLAPAKKEVNRLDKFRLTVLASMHQNMVTISTHRQEKSNSAVGVGTYILSHYWRTFRHVIPLSISLQLADVCVEQQKILRTVIKYQFNILLASHTSLLSPTGHILNCYRQGKFRLIKRLGTEQQTAFFNHLKDLPKQILVNLKCHLILGRESSCWQQWQELAAFGCTQGATDFIPELENARRQLFMLFRANQVAWNRLQVSFTKFPAAYVEIAPCLVFLQQIRPTLEIIEKAYGQQTVVTANMEVQQLLRKVYRCLSDLGIKVAQASAETEIHAIKSKNIPYAIFNFSRLIDELQPAQEHLALLYNLRLEWQHIIHSQIPNAQVFITSTKDKKQAIDELLKA